MADFASQIVAAKMQQVNSRISARMQQISSTTGIQFSDLFTQRINVATQVTPIVQETVETVDSKSVIKPVLNNAVFSRNNYDELISETAEKYGLDKQLVRAVVWAESNFNPVAISKAGAMGLMQLMPDTATLMGVEDAFDPKQNLDAGTQLLSDKIQSYDGDVRMALASYNAGAGGLARRGITSLSDAEQVAKLPEETRNYLSRIEGYLESAGAAHLLQI